ncbi:hypothetical protein RJ641_031966 [Dillenia turbinata]|uniref:C2H2-type domain-containing protein n=1 Tax=Dillenia turbinata TaxID=194707 RepID=A0AAN8W1Z0_9MAGN
MEKTKTPRRKTKKPPSWVVMRSIITCKNLQQQQLLLQQPKEQHKKQKKQPKHQTSEENIKKCKKVKCSGSLCSNTKVMHRPETTLTATALSTTSPEVVLHKKRALINDGSSSSSRSMKVPLQEINGVVVSSNSSSSNSLNFSSASNNNSSVGGSFRGNFRRFSGCYECRMVVDPVLGFTRDPSLRASICSCPDCGEIFMKAENLELHQAVRHAVAELGPDDTSKNIVEIIFQSSWLKKQDPVCKIDRVLKVHNTQKTITKFEEYRDTIKSKATKLPKKHPRCIADGNELLRFHCTTFVCSIGLNGSSNLCNNIPHCNGCSIIRHGFKASSHDVAEKGILTTATSGKAHDSAGVVGDDEKRAMLVCRVIAGRVKKSMEGSLEEYDSVAGAVGVYSNLDELYVFNPRAILPCFVVIYGGF